MNGVRLGAVGYLNARPLVYGLDRDPRFTLRFDVPARCAELLHAGDIDLGLIPSIEYWRGRPYAIVPDLAIASRGDVASVALFTTRPIRDVRSIAMDTSSRTSVALVRVLCARAFRIEPALYDEPPVLEAMLARADAALLIGDTALFQGDAVQKIDVGRAWTDLTGLPFVYAFWAGPVGTLTGDHVHGLQEASRLGVEHSDEIARAYCADTPGHQAVAARYLRDNIKYTLGPDERAGLDLFYRYAAELGLVETPGALRFF